MKKILLIFAFAIALIACKDSQNLKTGEVALAEQPQENYQNFGTKINAANSLTAAEMAEKFKNLNEGDTIAVKFRSKVKSVCKMKGCWMVLDLPGIDEDPMVKFKDYGFFVPKNIEDREVIVRGKAFVEETSVEDQKHFAEDAGQSKEEIEAINEPKKAFGFLADGVLLKE